MVPPPPSAPRRPRAARLLVLNRERKDIITESQWGFIIAVWAHTGKLEPHLDYHIIIDEKNFHLLDFPMRYVFRIINQISFYILSASFGGNGSRGQRL